MSASLVRRPGLPVALVLSLGLLAACGGGQDTSGQAAAGGDAAGDALSGTVTIDGSSTVFPISEAVAEEFQNSQRGRVRVTVGISGTGGGFKRFCRGETDISNASRPILAEEMELCRAAGIRYIELPIAFDALTVVVHPDNTWARTMTIDELKMIWGPDAQGKILRWNQVRPEWPDEPLMLFGAGADSGTFDYFTEAVNGRAKATRGDYTASEDDNVLVQGVTNNRNALGYFGYAYYLPHRERMLAVGVDAGKGPVYPSIEGVVDGTYQPLSRPMFIYVSEAAAARPEVREFIRFHIAHTTELVTEVGYVPLPPAAYETALGHFESARYGTVFGGHPEVGVTIEALLAREATL